MSSFPQNQESEFILEGQFLGFMSQKEIGKLKYLKLATESGVYWIKLAKPLRRSPQIQNLASCSSIRVMGTQKLDARKGKLKLKAYSLELLNSESMLVDQPTTPLRQPISAKILVCQKSSCRKRGAQKICSVLERNLAKRGLTSAVKIVETGCMKDCKAGPHIVIMPERKHYVRSVPSSIDAILDTHFPCGKTTG